MKRQTLPLILGLTSGVLSFISLRQALRRDPLPNANSEHPLAVITGASSGIGAAFARQLAARGYSLLLIARRQERLEALASELRTRHSVQVETLAADLAHPAQVETLAQVLSTRPNLALLINNAGFGIEGRFAEADPAVELAMLQVHAAATVRLTRAVLPGMLQRHNGAIINVSSVAAYIALGGRVMYASTKAYLNAFTEALHLELIGSGVRVQALCPGYTRTEFHAARGRPEPRLPGWLWLSADQVVRASLRDLQRGQVISIPTLRYRLLATLGRLIPRPVLDLAARFLIKRQA